MYLGLSCACLFMGQTEYLVWKTYEGKYPEVYGRYTDDGVGLAQMSKDDLNQFTHFFSSSNLAVSFFLVHFDYTVIFVSMMKPSQAPRDIIINVYTTIQLRNTVVFWSSMEVLSISSTRVWTHACPICLGWHEK